MKTKSVLIGIALLLLCGSVYSTEVTGKSTGLQQGTVTINCTPDLYPLTSKWANEYGRLNPEMKINVIKADYNSRELGTDENLSFISNKSQSAVSDETNWKVVVGRDLLVPVINAQNPFIEKIMKHGVSPEMFAKIFYNPDIQNWGTLLGNGENMPVHIYVVNDESVKTGVKRFLQSTEIPTAGVVVKAKDEVVVAIQNDLYAIGFCKLVDVLSIDNQGITGNICLLPIDKNSNGSIDHMEDIYSDVNTLLRGAWIGKYPRTLYSNIYAVSKTQPVNDAEIAFLAWVLTDGQQLLNANGYCDLVSTESRAQLEKFNAAVIDVQPEDNASDAGLILLIAAMIITLGVVVTAGVRHYRKQAPAVPDMNEPLPNFDENSVLIPKGLYFDKSHTWAFMEKDGSVTVGIDDFLQHITGPITRVEMKSPGEKIKKGDLLFTIIQIGKQLKLYAPVSGIIQRQNESLLSDSSGINSSPYNDGWIYRIEPSNWIKEVQLLDMADKYKKWISNEFSRVKDFLAATLKPDSLQYSHVVLQDGGLLKDGVLTDFGPEVWEDFQSNFLDTYK